MVSNLLQHEDALKIVEIVVILQLREVVVWSFSQLGKFIVEKGPGLQHSWKGDTQLYADITYTVGRQYWEYK